MAAKNTYTRAQDEHQAFLLALGELTLAWSDLEVVLFKILKHYAEVTWPIAQALFSGTRARSAVNFIRAIAANTAMETSRVQDLEEIFAQVLAINSLRDFVVHNVNGSEQTYEAVDPGRRYITDSIRTSRVAKAKTYLVGSKTLVAMRDDCVEACWRLHPHMDATNIPFTPGSGRGDRKAWRFMPPSQTQLPVQGW